MVLYRVEDKYDLPMNDFVVLKERVGAVMPVDGFSSGKEGGYKISSLYFDDLNNTCYNDTVAGNPVREKYRIRIYNDSFETIKLRSIQTPAVFLGYVESCKHQMPEAEYEKLCQKIQKHLIKDLKARNSISWFRELFSPRVLGKVAL